MEKQDEPAGSASVLILEDDWDHRNVFRGFLEHQGWTVREATEAASARDLLASDPVDVVVLDLGGTNGWALLEELGARPRRPQLLCLTGDDRDESRRRAGRLGADAYLVKPIPLVSLANALGALVGASPRTPAAARDGEDARAGSLPAPAAGRAKPAPEGPPGAPRTTPERPRPVVLLLEDDNDARVIYRDMLDFAGFEVLAACDGVEGLRFAETRPPDVVVTDLHMPGMNGLDVARTLRHEAGTTPAIIAVTADSLGSVIGKERQGDRPLFDEVLVKPVSPAELVRAVRSYAAPPDDEGG